MAITCTLNGQPASFDVDPETPLLWVLRETAGLTGTKFGCGAGACGACTVHVNHAAVRSCSVTLQAVAGASIVTIEGLGTGGDAHPVQQAWIDAQVPQCGYCQSGMIMSATALLQANPHPTDAEIDAVMTNLCRCGTYPRVKKAIRVIAQRT
jgi:isoquinoline 1-oxidoreductase subunit alpha